MTHSAVWPGATVGYADCVWKAVWYWGAACVRSTMDPNVTTHAHGIAPPHATPRPAARYRPSLSSAQCGGELSQRRIAPSVVAAPQAMISLVNASLTG